MIVASLNTANFSLAIYADGLVILTGSNGQSIRSFDGGKLIELFDVMVQIQ